MHELGGSARFAANVMVGAIVALVALVGLVPGTAPQPAAAAEPLAAWTGPGTDPVSTQVDGIGLSVGPGRVVLQGPVGGGTASTDLLVHVTAPFPVRVKAALADVALGGDGWPTSATLGATPWTLRDVATLTGNAFDYRPAFDRASFSVTVTAHAPAFEQPRVGVVVVSAVPADGTGQAATVQAVVVSGPDAASAPAVADTAPTMTAESVAVARPRWSGLDAALADPWRRLLDRGHATLTWEYTNTGHAVGMTATTIEIYELGPFGWLPFVHDTGTFVRSITTQTQLVLPGQQVTETLDTDLPAAALAPAWSLPDVGVVRVVFRTTSGVAGLQAAPLGESLVLVVVPWKEITAGILIGLAGVLLLILARRFLRRIRDARRRRGTGTVHSYESVSAISERTQPVRMRGRTAPLPDVWPEPLVTPAPTPAPPPAPTPATPPVEAGGDDEPPAPSADEPPVPSAPDASAPDPVAPAPVAPGWTTRRPMHGLPPKSGTPTL